MNFQNIHCEYIKKKNDCQKSIFRNTSTIVTISHAIGFTFPSSLFLFLSKLDIFKLNLLIVRSAVDLNPVPRILEVGIDDICVSYIHKFVCSASMCIVYALNMYMSERLCANVSNFHRLCVMRMYVCHIAWV